MRLTFRSSSLLAALWLGAGLFVSAIPARAQIVDSINGGSLPEPRQWAAQTVVFQYRPTFSYELHGIDSLFGSTTGGALTLDFWRGRPSAGGSLLASTVFTPVANVWSGGDFDSAVPVAAGTEYWVGFWNTAGQGMNATSGPDLTLYDWYPGSEYSGAPYPWNGWGALLHFRASSGSSAVPEPSTYGLFGAGVLVGLAFWRRRAVRR